MLIISRDQLAGCIGSLFVLFGLPASAGDWRLTSNLSLSLDNIARDNDNTADTRYNVLRVQPSFNLQGESGRSTASVDYSLSGTVRSGDSSQQNLSHALNAKAHSELYSDMVFLDATARAGLTTRSSNSASVDATSLNNDVIQTYAFTLSPRFRHHLGTFADVVSNNTLQYNGSDTGRNSHSQSLNIGVNSGRRFSIWQWSLGYTDTTRYLDTGDTSSRSLSANTSYRLSRKWRINGGIGHSSSDAPSRRSDNSSMTWNVGASWTPNDRTNLSTTFGHSYSGYNWNGSFSHLSRRTRVTANWSRSLTNSDTLLAVVLEPGLDADGLPVLDPITGLPLLEPITFLVPSDENFINTSTNLNVSVKGLRTTVTGSAGYVIREFDVSTQQTEQLTFRLSASRQLSKYVSANASVSASELSSDTSSDNSTYDLSFSMNTKIGKNSSLSGRFTHRIHDDDNGAGYSEQRVGVTLRLPLL